MESVFWIGVTVGLCGFAVCLFTVAASIIKQDNVQAVIFVVACLLCGLVAIGSYSLQAEHKKTQYDDAVAKNYTVYLDGTEIDPQGIDIEEYKCVIDDDLKVVKLTKIIRRGGSTYVPVVVH